MVKNEQGGKDRHQMQISLMMMVLKKTTSVERLLKGIVKRARTDAAADTAIKFGQQLRTGQASIKDPSSVIDVASQEFDKVC